MVIISFISVSFTLNLGKKIGHIRPKKGGIKENSFLERLIKALS